MEYGGTNYIIMIKYGSDAVFKDYPDFTINLIGEVTN